MKIKTMWCAFVSIVAIGLAEEKKAPEGFVGNSVYELERKVGELISDGRDRIERSMTVYAIRPDISHGWKKFTSARVVADRASKVCLIHLVGVDAPMAKKIMDAEGQDWKQISEKEGRRLYRSESASLYAVYAPGGELAIWNEARHAQYKAKVDPFGVNVPWGPGFSTYGDESG